MFSWVANKLDRKPDFDVTDVKPGQVVTLQIGKNTSFTGKWMYAYSVTAPTANTLDFPEIPLDKGTWYARCRIDGGKWSNSVPLTIV